MKFITFKIILILTITLMIYEVSNYKIRKLKFKDDNKSQNVTDNSTVVKEAPFNLTSCNNTLELEAETLKDKTLEEDYINREPGFFKVNLTHVGYYANNTSTEATELIDLSNLLEVPQILIGSVSCVKFIENKSNSTVSLPTKRISLCLKDLIAINQFLLAYNKLQTCRINKVFPQYDESQIQTILNASCDNIPKLKKDKYDSLNVRLDKNGKPLPKLNSTAIKDFMRKELENNGVRLIIINISLQ